MSKNLIEYFKRDLIHMVSGEGWRHNPCTGLSSAEVSVLNNHDILTTLLGTVLSCWSLFEGSMLRWNPAGLFHVHWWRTNLLGGWSHHFWPLGLSLSFLRTYLFANMARHIKVDFQSVLRTLESLFWFLVLLHVKYHKMQPFRNYLHEVNSKFKSNRHYEYEPVEA